MTRESEGISIDGGRLMTVTDLSEAPPSPKAASNRAVAGEHSLAKVAGIIGNAIRQQETEGPDELAGPSVSGFGVADQGLDGDEGVVAGFVIGRGVLGHGAVERAEGLAEPYATHGEGVFGPPPVGAAAELTGFRHVFGDVGDQGPTARDAADIDDPRVAGGVEPRGRDGLLLPVDAIEHDVEVRVPPIGPGVVRDLDDGDAAADVSLPGLPPPEFRPGFAEPLQRRGEGFVGRSEGESEEPGVVNLLDGPLDAAAELIGPAGPARGADTGSAAGEVFTDAAGALGLGQDGEAAAGRELSRELAGRVRIVDRPRCRVRVGVREQGANEVSSSLVPAPVESDLRQVVGRERVVKRCTVVSSAGPAARIE